MNTGCPKIKYILEVRFSLWIPRRHIEKLMCCTTVLFLLYIDSRWRWSDFILDHITHGVPKLVFCKSKNMSAKNGREIKYIMFSFLKMYN
jgi:hypothetical protein